MWCSEWMNVSRVLRNEKVTSCCPVLGGWTWVCRFSLNAVSTRVVGGWVVLVLELVLAGDAPPTNPVTYSVDPEDEGQPVWQTAEQAEADAELMSLNSNLRHQKNSISDKDQVKAWEERRRGRIRAHEVFGG